MLYLFAWGLGFLFLKLLFTPVVGDLEIDLPVIPHFLVYTSGV